MSTLPERDEREPVKGFDDLFARVGRLESAVLDMRGDVSEIKGTLAHVAMKADLAELRGDMASMEARLMRWSVGTAIALGGTLSAVMVAVARFVHP